MTKLITKYVDQQSLKTSLAFAVLYCVLFNSSIFIYKFNHYNTGTASLIFMIAKDALLVTASLFVFFFGFTLHDLLFRLATLTLFATGAFASYHMYAYEASLSHRLMSTLYGNNLLESYKFLSIRLIVWMIFSIAVCYSAIRHFKVQTPPQFFSRLLCALCLFLFVNCIISPPFDFLEDYFPTQFLNSWYSYYI